MASNVSELTDKNMYYSWFSANKASDKERGLQGKPETESHQTKSEKPDKGV